MRKLRAQEKHFLEIVLAKFTAEKNLLYKVFFGEEVKDMDDGGMGSIQFYYDGVCSDEHVGRCRLEGKFLDQDKVLVVFTIFLDSRNRISEVDFWKVNFDQLISLPRDLSEICYLDED